MVDSINVGKIFIGSRLVGGMLFNSVTKVTSFEYDPKWIKEGFSISPIKLPLTDEIFSFPHLSWDTYKGLPSALADTLPDDFGNAIINAWLVRNGRPLDEFSPLERLLYAGSRGMGALEYKPSIVKDKSKPDNIEIDDLVGLAQGVLDLRNDLAADVSDEGLAEILLVGTSAGGARPKAVIGINKKRDRILSGQRPLPTGFEHFLIKFDGVRERSSRYEVFGDPQGYGRIEYAYYLAAIDAGIFMMHSELLEEGGRAHFITKRFDRISNEKVHYQSLCAIDHADFKKAGQYSYEQIFDVMRRLTLPLADADQMMRRMIFNVLARNHDDHTKNFGFVYQEGQWALSPAFDIAYSYRPGSPWVERHQLTINGKRDDFSYADFEAALSHSSTLLGMLPKIFDEVKHSVLNLKDKMVMAGVPQKQQVALIKTFRLGIER
jgi:serine/threonine-protein kinase HipA